MRRIVAVRALMAAGDALIEVGIALLILSRAHGNVAILGLVLALPWAAGLAAQLGSLPWIDRVSRRRIVVWSVGWRAVLVLILAWMPSVALDAAAFFLIFLTASPANTALHALIPVVARDEADIRKINVAIQQWEPVAQASAYGVAGILFVGHWMAWGMGLAALPFVVALVVAVGLPVGTPAPPARPQRLKEVASVFQHNRTLTQLTILSGLAAFVTLGANVLTAPAMSHLWHQPTAHYGWALLAIAGGQWLGGVYLRRGKPMMLRSQLVLGFMGLTAMFGLLAASNGLWLALPALMLGGLANALFARAIVIWIQSHVGPEILGRVLTARGIIMLAGAGAGTVLAGWLGQSIGIREAFAIWAGGGMILVLLAAQLPA